MEFKLFAAKRFCGYCGGLIVVAANTIDEAYKTYIEWVKSTNNAHFLYEKYEYADGSVDIYDKYPKDTWYEIPSVKVICDAPQVIDKDGYTE